MTSPGRRSLNTAELLLAELVTNTLDPGYAAAARRREQRGAESSPHPPRWHDHVAIVVGCLLVGFVVVIAYVHQNRAAPDTATVHDALVQRVQQVQASTDQVAAQERALAANVESLRNAALGSDGGLSAELQQQELLAGTVAAKGPGLQVSLSDPVAPTPAQTAGRKGTVPVGAVQVLTDADIRSVVNQLWSDGAEAISVNDVRLTPTSAIRLAGEAVLVDFQPIASPYVIRAIGNANSLDTAFASSSIASRYQTLQGVSGINFTFDEQTSMTLPGSSAVAPRYAQASSSTTPASTPSSSPTPSSTGGTR